MKLRDLYSKPIDRAVNPAVSATKFDEETQKMLNNALEIVAGSKSEITKARKPTFELEYKDLNTNVLVVVWLMKLLYMIFII